MTASTDLDAMALAIAQYARSNHEWPTGVRTIADAYELLAEAAKAARDSERQHDTKYGSRPWPPAYDDLTDRVRRFTKRPEETP